MTLLRFLATRGLRKKLPGGTFYVYDFIHLVRMYENRDRFTVVLIHFGQMYEYMRKRCPKLHTFGKCMNVLGMF